MAQQKVFKLDAVFAPEATQKEVYDRSARDTVCHNIFHGYNTTIIAFGQMGSGKTFTMGGCHDAEIANFMDLSLTSHVSVKKLEMFTARLEEVDQAMFEDKEDDSIIPHAIHDLFKAKQHHELASEVTIHLTYLKIYNNELCDLLVDDVDVLQPSTTKKAQKKPPFTCNHEFRRQVQPFCQQLDETEVIDDDEIQKDRDKSSESNLPIKVCLLFGEVK